MYGPARKDVPGFSLILLSPALALAAAGMGVAIVPADIERFSVSGLVYRPITDLDGPEMMVLTRPGETRGTVVAFLNQLQEHQGRQNTGARVRAERPSGAAIKGARARSRGRS